MKNTNTKEYKAKVREYLEPIIIDMAHERGDNPNNPYQWVIDIAQAEVSPEFARRGQQRGLCEWLAGCGLSGLAVYNSEIIALAEQWHECTLTDKQATRVIELWFQHIAAHIIQFARRKNRRAGRC